MCVCVCVCCLAFVVRADRVRRCDGGSAITWRRPRGRRWGAAWLPAGSGGGGRPTSEGEASEAEWAEAEEGRDDDGVVITTGHATCFRNAQRYLDAHGDDDDHLAQETNHADEQACASAALWARARGFNPGRGAPTLYLGELQ